MSANVTSLPEEQHEADTPPPPVRSRSWTPLLLRLHFYAGVLVAPFLVVAALTGLAFVFTPQFDEWTYGKELHVASVAGPARPLSEQVAAAQAADPTGKLASVTLTGNPDDTTRVVFNHAELGEKQRTVYVDPYTNAVRGSLVTWFGETPLTTWLDDLHRNLHLDVAGRYYSEVAASWLWVLVVGGLLLWLRRQWNGDRRLRRILWPERTARAGVRRTRSWHATAGLWLAIGLLALSATGLTWSRYAGARFDLLQEGLSAHSPTLNAALPGGHDGHNTGGAPAANPAHIDRVVTSARAAGLHGFIDVTVPAKPGKGWTVAQNDGTWPVGFDRAVVDPGTGTVVARSDFTDWPVLAQLSKLGVRFHMGYLFGWFNQLILAATAIGLTAMIFWGYRMWWQRRPTRTDRAAPLGAPPARGAWRNLHPVTVAATVVVVAALAWALPLFGIPLIGFLLVDLALGARRRLAARRSA